MYWISYLKFFNFECRFEISDHKNINIEIFRTYLLSFSFQHEFLKKC